MDYKFGEIWSPISFKTNGLSATLNFTFAMDELSEVKRRWQEAFEWSYYDGVLSAIKQVPSTHLDARSFQGIFCIDDRECSLRRFVELIEPKAETFGTAGFFNLEFYFQPAHSELKMKVCPAPVTPKYLIKEVQNVQSRHHEIHFNPRINGLFFGWLVTQTYGFLSGIQLVRSIFFRSPIRWPFLRADICILIQIFSMNSKVLTRRMVCNWGIQLRKWPLVLKAC